MSPSNSRTASGFEVAAVRRPRVAALPVPIGEEFAGSTDVSFNRLACSLRGETHLSRFCASEIPFAVVQDGSCSVHAGRTISPRLGGGICGVNVKLTMRLAVGAELCYCPRIPVRAGCLQGAGAGVHRWRQTVWSSRGEGWGLTRSRQGRKRSARPGRVFSAPSPFLLWRCALAQSGQSRLSGRIAPRRAVALRSSTPWNPVLNPHEPPPDAAARADPDAAGGADGLCRADRGHPSAGAAAAGTRRTGPSTSSASSRSATIRRCSTIDLSRRHRRQGLDLRHLFAAARQSQPYRLQRAVAVAVRQRAGAAVRRVQVLTCSWR